MCTCMCMCHALRAGAIAVGEEGVLGELVRRVFAVERNAFQSHLSLFTSSTDETIKVAVVTYSVVGSE